MALIPLAYNTDTRRYQPLASSAFLPTGTILDYGGDTAPDGFILAYGQALPRTGATAALFSVFGTKFGAGDGSTTFNVLDARDRVFVGRGDMGGVAANRLTGTTTVGGVIGSGTGTLTEAMLPAHTHSINHDHAAFTSSGASTTTTSINSVNHTHTFSGGTANSLSGYTVATNAVVGASGAGGTARFEFFGGTAATAHSHSFSGTTDGINQNHTHDFSHTHSIDVPAFSGTSGSTGSAAAFSLVQPSIVVNKIIKL